MKKIVITALYAISIIGFYNFIEAMEAPKTEVRETGRETSGKSQFKVTTPEETIRVQQEVAKKAKAAANDPTINTGKPKTIYNADGTTSEIGRLNDGSFQMKTTAIDGKSYFTATVDATGNTSVKTVDAENFFGSKSSTTAKVAETSFKNNGTFDMTLKNGKDVTHSASGDHLTMKSTEYTDNGYGDAITKDINRTTSNTVTQNGKNYTTLKDANDQTLQLDVTDSKGNLLQTNTLDSNTGNFNRRTLHEDGSETTSIVDKTTKQETSKQTLSKEEIQARNNKTTREQETKANEAKINLQSEASNANTPVKRNIVVEKAVTSIATAFPEATPEQVTEIKNEAKQEAQKVDITKPSVWKNFVDSISNMFSKVFGGKASAPVQATKASAKVVEPTSVTQVEDLFAEPTTSKASNKAIESNNNAADTFVRDYMNVSDLQTNTTNMFKPRTAQAA